MRSVFYATTTDIHGEKERLCLLKAADLPIK